MINPPTEISVRTASSGDGFVGLTINEDSAEVIFPMGYHLSFEKNDMAVDIKNLILILHRFSEKKDGVLRISPGALHDVEKEIPVSPFLWILYDWKHNGYYKESESSYHSSLNGKIHWGRTIKIKKPLISGNSPVYLDFIVKKSEIKENVKATSIKISDVDLLTLELKFNTHKSTTHNECDSYANLALDDDWYKTN